MILQEIFLPRSEIIQNLNKRPWCDILVVGGGIHGVTIAHIAALNGLRTVLLEKGDYGSGASSRSSKLAHGGLRYLELFDFRQVFEGVRAREDLFQVAPHLVKPTEFLYPIQESDYFSRFKMKLGLSLYDLLSGARSQRRHCWISKRAESTNSERSGFLYWDGVMDDSRLVFERLVAARQEGALCLNYAYVDQLWQIDGGKVKAIWKDCAPGNEPQRYQLEAGIVLNCAGVNVASVAKRQVRNFEKQMRFSRGSHIVFRQPWSGPALILPVREGKKQLKGRYYFVIPHPVGTLVGTTEREVQELPDDPMPSTDEIQEIYTRLATDLPDSGLDASTAHYCFAGIRILPVGSRDTGRYSTARLSRRHRWVYSGGVLSLVGGKYTSATWTAYEGLRHALSLAEVSRKLLNVKGRLLPGAARYLETVESFRNFARTQGIPPHLAESAIARFGARVRFFQDTPDWCEVVGDLALKGEIELSVLMEQATCLEDVLRRRLEVQYLADCGLGGAQRLGELLASRINKLNHQVEFQSWRDHIESVQKLLRRA